ncbi:hypothetical protein [Sedimentibacter sp.]
MSSDNSRVKIVVVEANEEKIIAADTYNLCKE